MMKHKTISLKLNSSLNWKEDATDQMKQVDKGQRSVHIALGFMIPGKQRNLTKALYNSVDPIF